MKSKISMIMNTLIGSGFQVQNVSSKPSHLLLRVYRRDEFGIAQRCWFEIRGIEKRAATDMRYTTMNLARSAMVTAVLITALFSAGCPRPNQEVKLGFAGALSGPASFVGIEIKRGAEPFRRNR